MLGKEEEKVGSKLRGRLVFRRQSALVVEIYEDGIPYRAILTEDRIKEVSENEIEFSQQDFDMGLPFGLPFSTSISSVTIDPEALETELHKADIWTSADVMKNPKGVQGAILAASRVVISEIASLAREFSNKE